MTSHVLVNQGRPKVLATGTAHLQDIHDWCWLWNFVDFPQSHFPYPLSSIIIDDIIHVVRRLVLSEHDHTSTNYYAPLYIFLHSTLNLSPIFDPLCPNHDIQLSQDIKIKRGDMYQHTSWGCSPHVWDISQGVRLGKNYPFLCNVFGIFSFLAGTLAQGLILNPWPEG